MISTPTKKKLSNKNIFNYFYPHKASFIFKCRTLKV